MGVQKDGLIAAGEFSFLRELKEATIIFPGY
jgi:hypothetical protein